MKALINLEENRTIKCRELSLERLIDGFKIVADSPDSKICIRSHYFWKKNKKNTTGKKQNNCARRYLSHSITFAYLKNRKENTNVRSDFV